MLERFEGEQGHRLRMDALLRQRIVQGDHAIAEAIVDLVKVTNVKKGQEIITQDAFGNSLFFIFAGSFDIHINGRLVAVRGAGNHVGEMAAIESSQRRSATVTAREEAIVAELLEPDFSSIAQAKPEIYKFVARELARRLLERNKLVNSTHDKIKVFLICSAEALSIARIVQNAFQHDEFLVTLWTDGVFKVAHYAIESLENQVDQSDFAIAIAHADDIVQWRGQDWPAPRDNVVFELGMFLGRLGRSRAILMEPREQKVKLPSDLTGVTTITYHFEPGPNAPALLAPACNTLRDHIKLLGPNN